MKYIKLHIKKLIACDDLIDLDNFAVTDGQVCFGCLCCNVFREKLQSFKRAFSPIVFVKIQNIFSS